MNEKQVKIVVGYLITQSINLESEISFKATIELDLPVGDIITQGYASTEITENIVFKRD